MIYKLKQGDKEFTFGSWLPAMCFGDLLKVALRHNIPNMKYPVENCLDSIFQNIIDELDFREETDRGHSIHDSNIDVTYEMLYHNEFGLMFEGTGRLYQHPVRIYLEGDEDEI